MRSVTVEIINSDVENDATVHDYSTLVNCRVGKMCMIGKFSKMAYSSLGDLSYIGEYSIVIDSTIGKITSISWGVTIGPEEHDYRRVTNHSFLYSTKSFKLVEEKQYSPFAKKCLVGNDVWIGCNSTILRGVSVGDGAVIGANSLVNKDVPPYAIVVGSPARIIKYRFSEEVVKALIETEWWNLSTDIISENAVLFGMQPNMEIVEQIRSLRKSSER